MGGVCCEDVDDREAVLLRMRHEHPRHEREVEGHVALVAVAEVVDGVLRPLVGLGQQHAVGEARVDVGAQLASATSCVSGRFSQLVPSRSNRYGTASRRSPSTPISSQ